MAAAAGGRRAAHRFAGRAVAAAVLALAATAGGAAAAADAPAAGTTRPAPASAQAAPRDDGTGTPPGPGDAAPPGTGTGTAALPAVPAQGGAPVPAAGAAPAARALLIPVEGVAPSALRDGYDERRGGRRHEAIDIPAPRGTRVLAAEDGRVVRLFTSVPGGLTVYQFDRDDRLVYYYAHLDRYAEGLKEGMVLRRGDLVGYVGSTGNATTGTPHLHFAVLRLGPERRWWEGTPVNPYPLLVPQAPR